MRLLELPDYLNKWGVEVVLEPGWEKRGAEFPAKPRVVLGHHTATPASRVGDLPTLGILRDGRSDLPGPLCQVGGTRSGKAHIIASGKANHAGPGDWLGVTSSALTIGIEMEHPGTGAWDPRQLHAFDLIAVALCDMLGTSAEDYCGHREWANPPGRKVDPGGVDLRLQRDRIRRLLAAGPPNKGGTSGGRIPATTPTTPTDEGDDMPLSDADVKKVAAAVYAQVHKDAVAILRGADQPSLLALTKKVDAIAAKVGAT